MPPARMTAGTPLIEEDPQDPWGKTSATARTVVTPTHTQGTADQPQDQMPPYRWRRERRELQKPEPEVAT